MSLHWDKKTCLLSLWPCRCGHLSIQKPLGKVSNFLQEDINSWRREISTFTNLIHMCFRVFDTFIVFFLVSPPQRASEVCTCTNRTWVSCSWSSLIPWNFRRWTLAPWRGLFGSFHKPLSRHSPKKYLFFWLQEKRDFPRLLASWPKVSPGVLIWFNTTQH